MTRQLKNWWNQPDQFDTMTAILRQRDLIRSTQILLAVVAAAAGLVPLTALIMSAQTTTVVVIASIFGGGYSALVMGLFLLRWPTRRQSVVAAIGGAIAIAGWSFAQSDTTLRFMACSVLVVIGGYLAVLHNTKLMTLNFAISAVVAVLAVVQLGRRTTLEVAFAGLWVLWLLNLAICLGARGLSRAMTQYATYSQDDPLTGLLNRRGWTQTLARQLGERPSYGQSHLAALMIDLDGFKRINDTYGHAFGDRLLVTVAELLREHCPPRAAVCRAGGEEFFVTYFVGDTEPPPVAIQLCRAIASLPQGVTASIGTTSVQLGIYDPHNVTPAIDHLMIAADTAMYVAKRNGGNQTHHSLSDIGSLPTAAGPQSAVDDGRPDESPRLSSSDR